MSLIAELKRRNVFRVAIAYLFIGWLLTEVATTLLPTFDAPEWVAKVLIFIIALGFIPAVVFSWVYELTPEGIRKEQEVDHDHSITSDTGRKLNYITIAAAVMVVVFVAWTKTDTDSATPEATAYTVPPATAASVAVLPFVNMSGSQENEYFSDGLTETLLHMLAQIPDLQVAARTSSFAFKGQETDIREIALALGVAHVLEGSVQRAGDRVRITAQLIRATDGFHVWSENYDRTLDDIFGIQDEIAGKVGGALSKSLLGGGSATVIANVGTNNVNAYDLYLRALAEKAVGSYSGLQAAEGLLKDALSQDLNFLDAKIELAGVIMDQVDTGLRSMNDGVTDAIAFLEQVLAVRPTDTRARAGLAYALAVKYMDAGNFPAVAGEIDKLRKLVSELPNEVETTLSLAYALIEMTEEDEEVLALLENVQPLDPLNADIFYQIGIANIGLQNWDAAKQALATSLRIAPAQPNAVWALARIDIQTGDTLSYVKKALQMIELDTKDPEGPGLLALFLYEIDLPELAGRYLARSVSIAPNTSLARRAELVRAMVAGDESLSVAVAQKMIEDDIDDRRFAWQMAARHFVNVAAANGSAAEAFAFLDSRIAGFSDIDATPGSLKIYDGRFVTAGARKGLASADEVQSFVDEFVEAYKVIGVDILEAPSINVEYLVLRGDTSAAIEVALRDYFAEPLLSHLSYDRFFSAPYMQDVASDPRIQSELIRWNAEKAAMRDQVRDYLQKPQ